MRKESFLSRKQNLLMHANTTGHELTNYNKKRRACEQLAPVLSGAYYI